ncbi:MAG: two-component system cell cycle response regulator [Oleispira sp.]|jgi:two-component system cell cycle response regulator
MVLRSQQVTPPATTNTTVKADNREPLDCPQCGLLSPWANELMSLREQVITDPLTELFNVRYFRSALDIELERTLRTAIPTSLMMVDLDHFKKVNDVWGHEVGNQVLKLTARLIKQMTRQLDIQCRYGGEEFVVILPSTSLLMASQVAERLRQKIAESEITAGDETFNVTASIGLSVRLAHQKGTASDLIKAADDCLYQAKSAGRNQVCFAGVEQEEAMVSGDEKEALMGMFSDYND